MATGDVNFSYGAFAPGETVNLKARDVTPGLPVIDLALSAVAATNGSAAFAGVAATMIQHGVSTKTYPIGIGATSARQIGALPAP